MPRPSLGGLRNHPQSTQDSHYWEHSGAHQWGRIATEQFLPLKVKRRNWKPARRQQKAPLHTGTAPNRAPRSVNAQGAGRNRTCRRGLLMPPLLSSRTKRKVGWERRDKRHRARAHLTCRTCAGLTDRAHVRPTTSRPLCYLPGAQLLPCLPRHNRAKERLSALNHEPIAFSLERLSMEKS